MGKRLVLSHLGPKPALAARPSYSSGAFKWWFIFIFQCGYGSKDANPLGPQVQGRHFSFYLPIGFFRYPVFLTQSHMFFLAKTFPIKKKTFLFCFFLFFKCVFFPVKHVASWASVWRRISWECSTLIVSGSGRPSWGKNLFFSIGFSKDLIGFIYIYIFLRGVVKKIKNFKFNCWMVFKKNFSC